VRKLFVDAVSGFNSQNDLFVQPTPRGRCEKNIFCVENLGVADRVTGLGEFSPTERLFTLGSCCLIIKEVTRTFGLVFSTVKVMYEFCEKWVWATLEAIFWTNSSGHPGSLPVLIICEINSMNQSFDAQTFR
jgi:hypothetical protein